jgi:hypothetical protein
MTGREGDHWKLEKRHYECSHNFAYYFNFVAGRCFACLALQLGLGLLSKRGSGIGFGNSPSFAFAGKNLTADFGGQGAMVQWK